MYNIEKLKNVSDYLNQFTNKGEYGMRFDERIPKIIAGDNREHTSSTDFHGNIVDTYVKNDELFIEVNGWKREKENKEIRKYRFTFKHIGIYEDSYQYTISELRDRTSGNMCKVRSNHIEILIKGGRRFDIYS